MTYKITHKSFTLNTYWIEVSLGGKDTANFRESIVGLSESEKIEVVDRVNLNAQKFCDKMNEESCSCYRKCCLFGISIIAFVVAITQIFNHLNIK